MVKPNLEKGKAYYVSKGEVDNFYEMVSSAHDNYIWIRNFNDNLKEYRKFTEDEGSLYVAIVIESDSKATIYYLQDIHSLDPVVERKDRVEWSVIQSQVMNVEHFLEGVIQLGKKYGVSLSHEDGHGNFLIENQSDRLEDRLKEAVNKIKQ